MLGALLKLTYVTLTRALRSRLHCDLCFTDTETNQKGFSQNLIGSGGRSVEFVLTPLRILTSFVYKKPAFCQSPGLGVSIQA